MVQNNVGDPDVVPCTAGVDLSDDDPIFAELEEAGEIGGMLVCHVEVNIASLKHFSVWISVVEDRHPRSVVHMLKCGLKIQSCRVGDGHDGLEVVEVDTVDFGRIVRARVI
jgi:hypothetical protein